MAHGTYTCKGRGLLKKICRRPQPTCTLRRASSSARTSAHAHTHAHTHTTTRAHAPWAAAYAIGRRSTRSTPTPARSTPRLSTSASFNPLPSTLSASRLPARPRPTTSRAAPGAPSSSFRPMNSSSSASHHRTCCRFSTPAKCPRTSLSSSAAGAARAPLTRHASASFGTAPPPPTASPTFSRWSTPA